MSGTGRSVEELTIQLGTLQLNIRSSSSVGAGSEVPSFVLQSSPCSSFSSPFAGPWAAGASRLTATGVQSPVVEADFAGGEPSPWTRAWKDLLIAAQTPEELAALDCTPVDHLLQRLRATAGQWTPAARLVRALRAGVIAAERLIGRRGFPSSPPVPLANKFFVVLRGAPGRPRGFTEDASLYFRSVCAGGPGEVHPDSISHSFPTLAEVQAFCIGAGEGWPLPRLQADL